MDRSLLPHLPAVLAVARRRSFARAAAELGMGASAVSHAVRTVEARLGAPLFARTTRSVALTEAGAAFIARVGQAFEEIEAAAERLRADQGEVTGTLRLNVSRVAAAISLTPILQLLAERCPRLTVEVVSDEALTDVVGQGFDAGIRLGEMIAEDMTAVRLTPPFRALTAAAPAYLAARGAPQSLAELAEHNCIGFRMISAGGLYAWEFVDEAGRDVAVETRGGVVVTDATYARELALAGIGIAYVFEPLIRADLEAGRLVAVLPQHAVTETGLFAYFPRHAAKAPKLRAFLDAARAAIRATPPSA
jgi:DNA-binding transcriptional LysR family regulator